MTGPSDSSVQPLAKFCTCHETHPMECEGCRINRERAEARRAALPVAPSDEQILPPLPDRRALPVLGSGIAGHALGHTADQMREYALADRALPVAALSDADRDSMQQAAEALDLILDESVGDGTVRHRISAEMAYAAEQTIAAVRTRLLRHSEGKAE